MFGISCHPTIQSDCHLIDGPFGGGLVNAIVKSFVNALVNVPRIHTLSSHMIAETDPETFPQPSPKQYPRQTHTDSTPWTMDGWECPSSFGIRSGDAIYDYMILSLARVACTAFANAH